MRRYLPNSWRQAPPWATILIGQQRQLLDRMENLMATLDEVLADVTEEGTKIDSVMTLIDGLKKQIDDLNLNLSPEEQAKVDAIFAGVEANKGKVQAALDANAPPAPAPEPAPEPPVV